MIVTSLLCTSCRDNGCLHAKVAKLSIEDELYQEIEANVDGGLSFYFLKDNSVLIIDAEYVFLQCITNVLVKSNIIHLKFYNTLS